MRINSVSSINFIKNPNLKQNYDRQFQHNQVAQCIEKNKGATVGFGIGSICGILLAKSQYTKFPIVIKLLNIFALGVIGASIGDSFEKEIID